VEFFEKFYVDGEEENMRNGSGFTTLGLIQNLLEFFKVESKFYPVIVL
jgi:hypothetical protein